MEDVLEVYHRPYADSEVLVCLDETSKQQVRETRLARPPRPGAVGSYDYEYERNGMSKVSNLFMLFAPLEGWRRVEVTDRRTKADWARVVKKLVDEDYADRERIVLVMDNLNTHHPASLYEVFEPAEARRIAERLEVHYTPRHGSWLNPVLSLPKGWRRSNWGYWHGNAWTAGFQTKTSYGARWQRGEQSATGPKYEWTGASPPRTPASSSSPSTHHSNPDGLLVYPKEQLK